jgi:hypothetical protein
MAMIYEIPRGSLESGPMSLDYDSGLATIQYYNAGGVEIAPTGVATISVSPTLTGENFKAVYPSALGQWSFEGPVGRLRVSLAGTNAVTAALKVWRGEDARSGIPDGAFSGLRALTVQPYTEANVKNGLQYNVRAVWPIADQIAAGTSRKVWFKTNAKPVIVKLREFQYIAEELRIELFAGPTGVSGGTDLVVHNYNGVSPVATTVQAKKNVTITSNGTPFDHGDPEYFFGGAVDPQRQATSSIPAGRERILPANAEFAVVVSNTGASSARVQYFLDFYEGGTDLPLS